MFYVKSCNHSWEIFLLKLKLWLNSCCASWCWDKTVTYIHVVIFHLIGYMFFFRWNYFLSPLIGGLEFITLLLLILISAPFATAGILITSVWVFQKFQRKLKKKMKTLWISGRTFSHIIYSIIHNTSFVYYGRTKYSSVLASLMDFTF